MKLAVRVLLMKIHECYCEHYGNVINWLLVQSGILHCWKSECIVNIQENSLEILSCHAVAAHP